MNMSHHVHHLYFGNKPTKRRQAALVSKFPQYFSTEWLDKMAGQAYISENAGATYEHYLQTVLTTVEPGSSSKKLDAYEYTVQSHAYDAEDHADRKSVV